MQLQLSLLVKLFHEPYILLRPIETDGVKHNTPFRSMYAFHRVDKIIVLNCSLDDTSSQNSFAFP